MDLDIKLLGARVVRGPDWKWDEQDGGEGHVGTVVEVRSFLKVVGVVWDSGERNIYRAGCEGGFDLRLLQNSPAGVTHPNVECNECNERPLQGVRYRCTRCEDYDICSSCYMRDSHMLGHGFVRFDTPNTVGVVLPKREGSRKVEMKGIFTGAKVVRGPDWKWGDQDSSIHQKVVCSYCNKQDIVGIRWTCRTCHEFNLCTSCYKKQVHAHHKFWKFLTPLHQGVPVEKQRTSTSELTTEDKDQFLIEGVVKAVHPASEMAVRVRWPNEEQPSYRLGHKGMVDLVYTVPSSGGTYYKNHLPLLGQNHRMMKKRPLAVGDLVMYDCDYGMAEKLQLGHGGWNAGMAECSRQYGRVKERISEEEIRVRMDGNDWLFNTRIFTRIIHHSELQDEVPEEEHKSPVIKEERHIVGVGEDDQLNLGDLARVEVDPEQLKIMQEGHGGWVDALTEYIGEVGRVDMINDCVVQLVYGEGRSQTVLAYNPEAVTKVRVVSVGDLVMISQDGQLVRSLQEDRCGWTPAMKGALGCVGEVTETDSDGDIEVRINNECLWFDAKVCSLASQTYQNLEPFKDMTKLVTQKSIGKKTEKPTYSQVNKKKSRQARDKLPAVPPICPPCSPSHLPNSLPLSPPPPPIYSPHFSSPIFDPPPSPPSPILPPLPPPPPPPFPLPHQLPPPVPTLSPPPSPPPPSPSTPCAAPLSPLRPLNSPPRTFAPPPPIPRIKDRSKSLDDGLEVEEKMKKLERQMSEMKALLSCSICMERPRNLAFGCGHSTCQPCGDSITKCHLCRSTITQRIPLYE